MRCSIRSVLIALFATTAAAVAQVASTQPANFPEPPAGVIRVACIGDSITFGHGIKERDRDSYPAQLGRLLGDRYSVRNFGANGTTALRQGDRPYVARPVYAQALAYKPDVAIIGLGTNDTKPQNWTKQADFVADYQAMIADLRAANPAVRIFVCLPAPCYLMGETSIRSRVIDEALIPKIRTVAEQSKAGIVDLRSALDGRPELLPDTIHPNPEGARIIAEAVARAIRTPVAAQ
ncbi:MAG TPA: GDSL-type esterase/lipase family protein [Tepidisphaeraceae bacterium]|jgi:lysophospholipase L1-like esterase